MQLKTDKCNFIHLGRCVKSGAPNIPHDSPWLISPWSETPIISHEPNSTRMARRSPRGQFSGHSAPHSLRLWGREEERRGPSCQEGPEASTYGGGEVEGRGEEEEEKSGHEEEDGDNWMDGSWRPLARHTWRREGGREGGVMEKERYSREETRETKRKFKVSLNIYQRCVQMELLHPGGYKFKSGIIEGFIFLFAPLWQFPFTHFKLIRNQMPNPLKQHVSVNNKGHNFV